jgi:hypothetical protein
MEESMRLIEQAKSLEEIAPVLREVIGATRVMTTASMDVRDELRAMREKTQATEAELQRQLILYQGTSEAFALREKGDRIMKQGFAAQQAGVDVDALAKALGIVTDDKQRRKALLQNKQAASATFNIRKKAPLDTSPGLGTLIVHYDGQDMVQEYVHLLANSSSVHVFILESTKELYNTLSPILAAYGWERVKRYIHLSVWCRKKMIINMQE